MTALDAREIHKAGVVRCEDPWAGVPVIGGGVPEVGEPAVGPPSHSRPEGVAVRCNAALDPCALVYRGRELRVLQPVIHWFERCNWWDTEERVPRESATSVVDREYWRVQAAPAEAGIIRTFDLTRDQATGWWQVLRVSP
ncbi:DUF6504 family protein [Kocuria sp.]|uniref:DUF6504 family protein n=1 Tax=Kocuria sp. TaxID=1871328 RepID=UPI0026DCCD08|nr:DUF6504 family protein [Kocuria sp.]MDO4918407.1 DUF6504 family protein [Kocuria sp.]